MYDDVIKKAVVFSGYHMWQSASVLYRVVWCAEKMARSIYLYQTKIFWSRFLCRVIFVIFVDPI